MTDPEKTEKILNHNSDFNPDSENNKPTNYYVELQVQVSKPKSDADTDPKMEPNRLTTPLSPDPTGTVRSYSSSKSRFKPYHHTPKNAKTNHFIMISGIYAKLLIVTGAAFIISEVITKSISIFYFEVFFTYLYIVSIIFLLYVYFYLLRQSSKSKGGRRTVVSRNDDEPAVAGGDSISHYSTNRRLKISENEVSHGSFFLRVGAVGFGLGTMIYNGLEFGGFFETPEDSPCYSILSGVNPILQMVFTFAQMYFIFRNARLNIHKFKVIARFGLMHIVATNICIWIRTLVRESIEEISEQNIITKNGPVMYELIRHDFEAEKNNTNNTGMYNYYDKCKHQKIMGDIEEQSEPYIYPFIIEYSLIGAAVLYVMWKHIGPNAEFSATFSPSSGTHDQAFHDELQEIASQRSTAHVKVDCMGTSKGLFFGLFLLVGVVIAIILFFVLIDHDKYGFLATYLGDVSHIVVLVLSIIAILIGFIRIRSLHFKTEKNEELSDILLGVSSLGIYLYAVLGVISSCRFSFSKPELFTLAVSGLTIIQVTLQSLFMADMSRRTLACSLLSIDAKQKPGRQIVTFLLISNLTFWVVYTFQTQSILSTPTQLEYFGVLAWAVIIRVCQPLAIFYRFHSAVMFAEIWKNAYKTVID